MVKIKGGAVEMTSIITNIIKYGVLLLLFGGCINYINEANIQYIIFIVLLITVILGGAIFMKDLSDLSTFMTVISNIGNKDAVNEFSLEKNNPFFLQLFMLVIGIAVSMKIISLVFFIIILSNGRKELKPKDFGETKRLSSHNLKILNQYTQYFKYSIILIVMLCILIFITYGSVETQMIMKNITGIGLSVLIIIFLSLEMYHSIEFLKIKDKNGLLYEITYTDVTKKV